MTDTSKNRAYAERLRALIDNGITHWAVKMRAPAEVIFLTPKQYEAMLPWLETRETLYDSYNGIFVASYPPPDQDFIEGRRSIMVDE